MKVSNVGRLNFRPVKMLDRPEGGFSDLVKLELEEKICSGELTKEIKTRDGETIRLSYGKGSEEYDPEHMIIIKCTAWGRTFQTNEELSRFYPHCSLPMDVELVHVDLSAMTDEKRAELNKKYQIDSCSGTCRRREFSRMGTRISCRQTCLIFSLTKMERLRDLQQHTPLM